MGLNHMESMKCLILSCLMASCLIFSPFQVFSAPDDSNNQSGVFKKEGQLVSVQLTPGKPIKIFVVGREEAQVDLKKLDVKIRRVSPGPGATLEYNLKNGFYEVKEVDAKDLNELEITTTLGAKSEKFHFQLKTKK